MSSFSVKGSLRMDGSKWLCHRSRHCLPFRPLRNDAMCDHRLGLCSRTSSTKCLSSSAVHRPFVKFGFRTFCHRCKHCSGLRFSKWMAINFQFRPAYCCTSMRSFSSSFAVHPAIDEWCLRLFTIALRVCGDPDVNCAFPTKPLPVTLAPVPCGEIVVPCGEIDVACAGMDVACGEIDFPCGDIDVTIDVTCGEISGAVRRIDIDTSAGLALCTRGGETRAGENGGVNIFLLAAIGVGGVLLFS